MASVGRRVSLSITALCGSVPAMSLAGRAAEPHVFTTPRTRSVRSRVCGRAGDASPSCRRRNLSVGQRIQVARCAMRSLKFILLLSAILALGRPTIGLAEDQNPVTILRGTSAPPPPPSPPDPPPVGYEDYGYTPGYDVPYYLPYYFLSAPHRFFHGNRFFHANRFHANRFQGGGFDGGGGHR